MSTLPLAVVQHSLTGPEVSGLLQDWSKQQALQKLPQLCHRQQRQPAAPLQIHKQQQQQA